MPPLPARSSLLFDDDSAPTRAAVMLASPWPLRASDRRGADRLDFCGGWLVSVDQQVKLLDEGRSTPWVDA